MVVRLSLVVASALLVAACSTTPAPTAPSIPAVAMMEIGPKPTPTPTPDPVARYVVTLNSTWSEQTHPVDWPFNAHYSGLIGGTHNAQVTFWQEGQLASAGIQAMAERGRKSPLDAEVAAAIAVGTAQQVLSGDDIPRSPGSVSLEFEVSVGFPLVTLVTMVAPSPDWFVGVSGTPLLVNNRWLDEYAVTLYPWDAGSDSGVTYQAADLRTMPLEPIRPLTGFPVAANGAVAPFGTLAFRRIK